MAEADGEGNEAGSKATGLWCWVEQVVVGMQEDEVMSGNKVGYGCSNATDWKRRLFSEGRASGYFRNLRDYSWGT